MSRMSKYLKQTSTLERIKRNGDGSPIIDTFGKYQYEVARVIKCRCEPGRRNSQTTTGQYAEQYGTYYVDEQVEVGVMDKIDNHLVLEVYPYYDGSGTLVGYEVHV